ncbi:MAG TPA: FkbM family methyltransferase [Bacillus sp. (in: firmicutes)]|nr:FkbM family methyltransferase [Bacillus sp. (in: firmicutes)]
MEAKALLRKPVFMKMWEKYPKTWKLLIDAGILLKYKTLNINRLPNQIKLPSCHVIYVNPRENRGRALLIKDGVTQARLAVFWSQAVRQYKPSLVVDVGVNYGECLFSVSYPSGTRVYGIEANQHLFQYIMKSREEHPNKEQIHLVHAFASDRQEEEQLFYIDTHWSGTSSASYMPSHQMVKETVVPTITIDSLFETEEIYTHDLLFKVDVEGFEGFVLKGMEKVLKNCRSAVGMMEFDSHYIQNSGMDIEELFGFLQRYFTIYVYDMSDRIVPIPALTYTKLQKLFKSEYVHTDFLLLSDNVEKNRLGLDIG